MSRALEDWVNPVYVDLYRAGRLASLRTEDPFTSAVLPDFLRPEALDRVLDHVARIPQERSHRKGIAARADWYWGAFSYLDYLRFFLGPEMRAFMNELMGERLALKPQAVPQFNTFRPGSKGIPVHTDLNEKVGVVSLLQLSEGYTPGRGGELVFYQRQEHRVVPTRYVQPICNTLILFLVSEKSYHSVADMNGEWTRRTITYDWLTEVRCRVPISV